MTGKYNPKKKLDSDNHPLMNVTFEHLAAMRAHEQKRFSAL